jgi:hypothetical protein
VFASGPTQGRLAALSRSRNQITPSASQAVSHVESLAGSQRLLRVLASRALPAKSTRPRPGCCALLRPHYRLVIGLPIATSSAWADHRKMCLLPPQGSSLPPAVDAADWLRHDLDVSKPLWGEACLAMGREQAAIALAVVSTKDPAHFRTTAGGYFHGMVAKAKAGALNLDRTLWAMRRAAEPKPRSQPATGGGGRHPSERPWS